MKARPLAFLILSFLCAGCFSIKEEIYLNRDGGGEYLVYTDMIGGSRDMMMSMMTSLNPDADEDSLFQVIEEQLWREYPAEVDSVLDISDKVPDSIRNDPEKRKYLDRMEMFMKGSRKEGYLNSGLRFSFSGMEELESFMKILDEGSKSSSGDAQLPTTQFDHEFSKNSFSRQAVWDPTDEALEDSTMMALDAMLKESSWQLIVHLPKKVKAASKEQLVSKDGKTVTYEYDFMKIISGEQSMAIKVEF